MSLNYGSDAETQFGEILSILSKRGDLIDHVGRGDDANFDRRLLVVTNGFDVTDTVESAVHANIVNRLDDVDLPLLQSNIRSARDSMIFGRTVTNPGLAYLWLKALGLQGKLAPTTGVEYIFDESFTDGTVAILQRKGIIGEVRNDMELTVNSQRITANGVTFGAFTPKQNNVGLLTLTTMTGESHVPSSTFNLICNNNSATRPEFDVSIALSRIQKLWSGEDIFEGRRVLTAEKAWEDGFTGLSLEFTRTGLASPTVIDADALFSSESVATPHDGDSDIGVFHIRVTRQSGEPRWLIECFADSSLTTKTGRVTTNSGSGNITLVLTCNNGSALTFDFQRTTADAAMAAPGNISTPNSFDIDNPREGDHWTRTVTNDEVGNFATLMMKLGIRMSLPVTGTNLWLDSLALPYQIT